MKVKDSLLISFFKETRPKQSTLRMLLGIIGIDNVDGCNALRLWNSDRRIQSFIEEQIGCEVMLESEVDFCSIVYKNI